MRFTKLHGCGNDYLYVDCFHQPVPPDPSELARRMSNRHFGVGSDGLILVLPSDRADARMRMFNADGSEGTMCGNGLRAMAKFVFDHGLSRNNPLRVETLRGILSIDLHLDSFGKVASATVDMDEPILESGRIPVQIDGIASDQPVLDVPIGSTLACRPPAPPGSLHQLGLERMSCLSMGSAHAVIFGPVETVPLSEIGPWFEHHPAFPQRVNVHFARALSRDEVTMRTWERGSGATLACGTGACAVVVAGVLTGRLERNVRVHLPGGELRIEWRQSDNHVYKTGPAVEVFSGEFPG
ncbi:MAG: diaminopimelate epimerase [Phycisphaerae bacterium]|nr:diaminopimelate epimerase [Phycisphaerae bacterium]